MQSLKEKIKKLPEKTTSSWATSLDKEVLNEINEIIVAIDGNDPEVVSRIPSYAALHEWLVSEGVINVGISSFREYARKLNVERQVKISSSRGKNRS